MADTLNGCQISVGGGCGTRGFADPVDIAAVALIATGRCCGRAPLRAKHGYHTGGTRRLSSCPSA